MRFKDAMNQERREAQVEPKALPKKEQESKESMDAMKREIHTTKRVRKLLGTGRSAK